MPGHREGSSDDEMTSCLISRRSEHICGRRMNRTTCIERCNYRHGTTNSPSNARDLFCQASPPPPLSLLVDLAWNPRR